MLNTNPLNTKMSHPARLADADFLQETQHDASQEVNTPNPEASDFFTALAVTAMFFSVMLCYSFLVGVTVRYIFRRRQRALCAYDPESLRRRGPAQYNADHDEPPPSYSATMRAMVRTQVVQYQTFSMGELPPSYVEAVGENTPLLPAVSREV
jgi:hypothetical protein